MKKSIPIIIYIFIGLYFMLAIASIVLGILFLEFKQKINTGVSYYETSVLRIVSTGITLIVVPSVFAIISLFVGLYSVKKFKNAKNKDDLIVPSILCIIFGFLISGILMLVITEKDMFDNKDESFEDDSLKQILLDQTKKGINDEKSS